MRARVPRASGRHHRVVVALLTLTVLLSGCASMPSDGEVTRVSSSHRAKGEARVRVFGVSPQEGESPQGIVRGFLEAITSDEPRFETARDYLTNETARAWDPFAGTTVLEGGPVVGPGSEPRPRGESRDVGVSVTVSGTRMARVDGTNAYDPDRGDYSVDFHLTKVKKGWRIDQLPDGLILGQADFERIYRTVNTYFFAKLGPGAASVSGGHKVLVADPVYLRARIDPVTETVSSLIQGPSAWLAPVVTTAFPEGTRLARGEHLSLDDSGALSVRLNKRGATAGDKRCTRMAAQVLHSVQSQASTQVDRVELKGPGGERICELTREQAQPFAPGRLGGENTKQYFIDAEHRVAAVAPGTEQPTLVQGPLGSGAVALSSVGISRDERQAAGVSLNQRALYVAGLAPGGELGEPVLVSDGEKEYNRLTAPSWDGLGDLWIADRDPQNPRLLRLRGGTGEPEVIEVPGLSKGERIEGLRVSSDGVRIAIRVLGVNGDSSLQLGRVERGGTAENPTVTVAALRPVAPQLEDVVAMSWAGPSRLVVLGRESRGVQQLQYVGTDGSTTNQPTLPGINEVRKVAASEEQGKPLLAESKYGIVRLPPNANWKTLAEGGTAPVYPG